MEDDNSKSSIGGDGSLSSLTVPPAVDLEEVRSIPSRIDFVATNTSEEGGENEEELDVAKIVELRLRGHNHHQQQQQQQQPGVEVGTTLFNEAKDTSPQQPDKEIVDISGVTQTDRKVGIGANIIPYTVPASSAAAEANDAGSATKTTTTTAGGASVDIDKLLTTKVVETEVLQVQQRLSRGEKILPSTTSEEGEAASPPPLLQRNTPGSSAPISRPGAFPMAPSSTVTTADPSSPPQPLNNSTSPLLDLEVPGVVAEDHHHTSRSPNLSPEFSPPGDHHLSVAFAVDDSPLPGAVEMEEGSRLLGGNNNKASNNKKIRLIGISVAVVVIVIVLVIALLLVGDEKSADPTTLPVLVVPENSTSNVSNNSVAPTISPEEARILSLLPPTTIQVIRESNTSSQAFALDWLVQDPHLMDYPDWRVRQRFALATFFDSTGGVAGHWKETRGWLSYEHHECDWSSNTFGTLVMENPEVDVANVNLPGGGGGGGGGPPPGPPGGPPPPPQQQPEGQPPPPPPGPPPTMIDPFPCGMDFNSSDANQTVIETEGQYVNLLVVNNNLVGTIPKEIFFLTSLIRFDLTTNALTGSLPKDVGLFTSLSQLHLGFNQLTGSIPSELFSRNLWICEMHINRLTGSIPTEVGLATNLAVFVLDENDLTGTVPTELGLLGEKLDILAINRNALTSSLPTEVGMLTNLGIMDLRRNSLSSAIPSELGNMINLFRFSIYDNHIFGSIPTEIGFLQNLAALEFPNGELNSTIPSELGLLGEKLEYMVLHDNNFSGTIPLELGQLTKLQVLTLAHNQIEGSIPAELFGSLPQSVKWLDLSWNYLTGVIPNDIGQLNGTEVLFLERNRLTSSIPTEIGLMTSLKELFLYGTELGGFVPTELGLLDQISGLYLHDNYNLEGPVPGQLGKLSNLQNLWIHESGLTGSFPLELCNLIDDIEEEFQTRALVDCQLVSCSCGCTCPSTNSSIYGNNGEYRDPVKPLLPAYRSRHVFPHLVIPA